MSKRSSMTSPLLALCLAASANADAVAHPGPRHPVRTERGVGDGRFISDAARVAHEDGQSGVDIYGMQVTQYLGGGDVLAAILSQIEGNSANAMYAEE